MFGKFSIKGKAYTITVAYVGAHLQKRKMMLASVFPAEDTIQGLHFFQQHHNYERTEESRSMGWKKKKFFL